MGDTKIDIHEVVEILRQSQADKSKSKVSNRQQATEWLEVKNIDTDSMDEVLDKLTGQMLERVIGKLGTTNNPKDVAPVLRDMIGAGFELGYTSAELQLEQTFLSGEVDDAESD